MKKKILTANCIHCDKEVASMYQEQLNYNIQAHELSCPKRKKDEAILKGDRIGSETSAEPSLS